MAEENDDNEQGGRTAANAAMKRIAEKELREIRKRQRRKRMIVFGLSFSLLFLAIFGSLFTIKSNLDLSRNMVRSPEVRILGYDGALLETIKGHYSQDVSLTTLPERVQNVFVAATDPDGDTMTYALTDDASGLFTIDAATGTISLKEVDPEFTQRTGGS